MAAGRHWDGCGPPQFPLPRAEPRPCRPRVDALPSHQRCRPKPRSAESGDSSHRGQGPRSAPGRIPTGLASSARLPPLVRTAAAAPRRRQPAVGGQPRHPPGTWRPHLGSTPRLCAGPRHQVATVSRRSSGAPPTRSTRGQTGSLLARQESLGRIAGKRPHQQVARSPRQPTHSVYAKAGTSPHRVDGTRRNVVTD